MTCVKNFEEEKLALVKNWLQLNNFEVTESHFPEDGTVSSDDIVDEQLFEFKDQRRLSGSITDKGRKVCKLPRGESCWKVSEVIIN